MNNTKKQYLFAFWLTLCVSLGLMVGGFLSPPTGEIHGSVLEAAGILFLWPALAFGNKALEEGKVAKFNKGDIEISIGKDGNEGEGI